MQTITDWEVLWKELYEIKKESQKSSIETPGNNDYWQKKAREFDANVQKRWQTPDSSRDTILKILEPGSTLLDIGAGTGSWSVLFSNILKRVTALEPSSAMREILIEKIQREKIKNIEVVEASWPDADPGMFDYTFCSHAMYGTPDFRGFVQQMIDHTRKMCFLLIRAPSQDGLITEAFKEVWGQPYDSPNFIIAYNILMKMGIIADVCMEVSSREFFLTSPSLDDAFVELKSRIGLQNDPSHDAFLHDLLLRRLVKKDGQYYWPGTCPSALVYWKVNQIKG